jgi:integrase
MNPLTSEGAEMKTVEEVLAALSAIRPLTKATIANYRRAIVYYGNFIGRDPLLSDLNEQRVSEWLRQEEARYPASYVRNLRRDLLVSWRFAGDLDVIPYPRTRLVRLPKREPHEILAWPLDWIPKLIAACDKLSGQLRDLEVKRSVYASAYFRTQIDLPCRPTDMRLLTWTAISSDGVVRWRQSKTSVFQRARLSADTLEAVEKLRGFTDRYRVFPLSKSTTERLIAAVFVAAGIAKPRRQSLGHVRHTGGTAIAAKSGNDRARTALGHTPGSRIFEANYLDQSKVSQDFSGWWVG